MDCHWTCIIGGLTDIEDILKRWRKAFNRGLPPDLMLLVRLGATIEEHYKQERSQVFYCEKLNIDLYRLNNILIHHTGKTLFAILQDRIHQEALNLLTYSSLSVKQISFELGCSDPPYLTRCFKKREGVSPIQFRRNNKAEGN